VLFFFVESKSLFKLVRMVASIKTEYGSMFLWMESVSFGWCYILLIVYFIVNIVDMIVSMSVKLFLYPI